MIRTRKITACTKRDRTAESLSNFMPGCRQGNTAARQAFIDTINRQPMEPLAICKALNDHKWTTETFKPYRPLTNGISLIATDPFGNDHIIKITESED